MFPRTYYETFMRYEASDEIFVAMPFSDDFKFAYDSIIEPAIKRVLLDKKPLKPRIINRGTSGAPDIHERIFDAILHSRIVIADMTVQASVAGSDGKAKWQANANVAYEVGLAAAWRNPEDILLIHQSHKDHSYSFDVQNLRHFEYDLGNSKCVDALVGEIVRALNQSSFLSLNSYQSIIRSLSPSAIQYMHTESQRAFPVIGFPKEEMPLLDSRIHAAAELLSVGALRNRNVRRSHGSGVTIVYQWTELGLRLLRTFFAITEERQQEIRAQIASVSADAMPPPDLLTFKIQGAQQTDSPQTTAPPNPEIPQPTVDSK